MNLYNFLRKKYALFGGGLIFIGVLSGLVNIVLISIINRIVENQPKTSEGWLLNGTLFLLTYLLFFGIPGLYHSRLVKHTANCVENIRANIFKKVRSSFHEKFESTIMEKIYTILTHDTVVISRLTPHAAVSFAYLASLSCGIVYMFFLAPKGALVTALFTSVFLVSYFFRLRRISTRRIASREAKSRTYGYIENMLRCADEGNCDSKKPGDHCNEHINSELNIIEEVALKTDQGFMRNQIFLMTPFYVMIGFILFAEPLLGIKLLNGYVNYLIILMLLTGLMNSAMKLFHTISEINISVGKIEEFDELACD